MLACGLAIKAKVVSKLKKKDKERKSSTSSTRSSPTSTTAETGEQRARTFKGYDLKDLPFTALPIVGGDYKGSHNYTCLIGGAVP